MKRYVVAGSFIDGSGAGVRRNVFLEVTDGYITAIGPAAALPGDAGLVVDDLSHCTIVPALIDCSVSLARSPAVDWEVRLAADEADMAEKAAMVERHIHYCHIHGVLGVADDGDAGGLVERHRLEKGANGAIDIRTAGRLWRSRGDGAADDPRRADFIKIAYSGNIEDEEPPRLRLGADDLRRMLHNRRGQKAVVVANGAQQVSEALAAGCDGIEQGYGMGEENLRIMAEQGTLWIPSVNRAKVALLGSGSGGIVCCRFSLRYVAPGKAAPGVEAYWKKTLAAQLALLRLARRLGVTTAVGTGAGGIGLLHGESMVEEMKMFLKAGFTLVETIRSASETGARFFGMEGLGRLVPGRPATFLVTRGGVSQLPRKLSYLEGIYINGSPSGLYHKMPGKGG